MVLCGIVSIVLKGGEIPLYYGIEWLIYSGSIPVIPQRSNFNIMKKFEYKIRLNCTVEELNALGELGWNVVNIVDTQIARRFYMKRVVKKKLIAS